MKIFKIIIYVIKTGSFLAVNCCSIIKESENKIKPGKKKIAFHQEKPQFTTKNDPVSMIWIYT